MTTSTSTMFDTWDWLLQVLQGLQFGTSDLTVSPVQVSFGGPDDGEMPYEAVILHAEMESNVDQEWATFGPGRKDENFGVIITVHTSAPGATADQVRVRLRDMTAAVEAELRTRRRPEVDNVLWWSVAAFRPSIYPTEHGYVGRCRIVANVRAYL